MFERVRRSRTRVFKSLTGNPLQAEVCRERRGEVRIVFGLASQCVSELEAIDFVDAHASVVHRRKRGVGEQFLERCIVLAEGGYVGTYNGCS